MTDEMKDPVRLISSAEDSLLRDALRAGEAELGTSDQLAVVAAKLGPILGGGGVGGAGSGGGAAGAAKGAPGLLGGTTAKLVVSLGIGAIVATAGYVAMRSPSGSGASSSVVDVPAPTTVSTSITPASVDAETAPSRWTPESLPAPASARPSTNRVAPVHSTSVAPPAETPDTEVRTLQKAQDALGTDPARALSICDEHPKRFPNGILNEEREVIAIDALARLGKTDEALARAGRFRAAHPSSGHLGRIEVLVGKGF